MRLQLLGLRLPHGLARRPIAMPVATPSQRLASRVLHEQRAPTVRQRSTPDALVGKLSAVGRGRTLFCGRGRSPSPPEEQPPLSLCVAVPRRLSARSLYSNELMCGLPTLGLAPEDLFGGLAPLFSP